MKAKQMNPIPIIIVAAILVIALVVTILVFATNVLINGHLYPKKAEFLNLRGKEISAQEYETIRKKLPKCDVYWDVPLSGGAQPENTQVLHISSLSDEDVKLIGYFEHLQVVEAGTCSDYAQLAQLRQMYPQVPVVYNVTIDGTDYPYDATEIEVSALTDTDIDRMQYLPNLTMVHAGKCNDYNQVEKLKAAYPELTVATTVTIGGKEFDGETTQLQTSGITAEEAVYLKYLPKLQSAHLANPAIDLAALQALQAELPNVTLTWDVTISGQTLRSDAKEVEIAGIDVDVEQLKQTLAYLPDLEMVFLNDCNVNNDAMAALREEMRDQYKVVWTVNCGPITVRTDATYFYPTGQRVYYFFDEDAENLVYCEDMICVDVGHMPIHNVEWLKGMPKLKYLILAHTQVAYLTGIENCKELVFLELDWSPVKDFTPLLECTALEDLNIGKTYADVEPLTQMTWLKHLWCVDRSAASVYQLRQALEETGTVLFAVPDAFTVGGIWRQLPNYYAMRDALGAEYML